MATAGWTTNEERSEALAVRWKQVVEHHTFANPESLFAPDVVLWKNIDGRERDLRSMTAEAATAARLLPGWRIENYRRSRTDSGFVERFTGVTRRDGAERRADVCIVVEIRDGLIARIEEYFDSRALDPAPESEHPANIGVATSDSSGRDLVQALDEGSAFLLDPASSRVVDGRIEFVGARCDECATEWFPPSPRCPRCASAQVGTHVLPATGAVRSWTTVRVAPAGWPGSVPFTLVRAQLLSGPIVTTHLSGGGSIDPRDSVRLVADVLYEVDGRGAVGPAFVVGEREGS